MSAPLPASTMAHLRTILVRVTPTPATLSERRAILGVLKQHTVVDYFRKLHDPSHFISVVATPQMAQNLIAKSPFQFDYVAQKQAHEAAAAAAAAAPPTTPTPTGVQKTFRVKIVEKPEYKHKTRMRDLTTYDRWPELHALFQPSSIPRAALQQAVPRDMAFHGLADWESAGQLDGDDTPSTRFSFNTDYVRARSARRAKKPAFESLAEAYKARHGDGEGGGGRGGAGPPV